MFFSPLIAIFETCSSLHARGTPHPFDENALQPIMQRLGCSDSRKMASPAQKGSKAGSLMF
jgi:hypothetical protein